MQTKNEENLTEFVVEITETHKKLFADLKTFFGFLAAAGNDCRELWFAFCLVASKSIVILGQEKFVSESHLREFSTS